MEIRPHRSLKDRATRFDRVRWVLIGERLKVAREAEEFTQTTVARTLGMKQSEISKIESGEREIPVLLFWKLAAIYGVEPQTLMRPFSGPSWPGEAKRIREGELRKKYSRMRGKQLAQKQKKAPGLGPDA